MEVREVEVLEKDMVLQVTEVEIAIVLQVMEVLVLEAVELVVEVLEVE